MYSTCIFCHSDLEKNESIEHFPIGHRLAFDAARGRLWVVCRKCERWNLTPLDERWEAIEECERAFRATKLRVSTDNVGLARLRDGTELVRIGAPQRPEMAAWRYGDQFGRRRKRYLLLTGAAVVAGAGVIILGPVTGIIAGSSWGLWNIASTTTSLYQQHRVRARVSLIEGQEPVPIRLKQLSRAAIVREYDDWALRIAYQIPGLVAEKLPKLRPWNRFSNGIEATAIVRGAEALRVAAKLLPAINESGANRNEVTSAVEIMEETASPEKLFARYANTKTKLPWGVAAAREVNSWGWAATADAGHPLQDLPKHVRLALEMATHEESERRALDGELSVLQAAWQEAEEIAAIADDMFIDDATRQHIAELKSAEERKKE
jgi:hypothetical protein